jgi:hypothetical protein
MIDLCNLIPLLVILLSFALYTLLMLFDEVTKSNSLEEVEILDVAQDHLPFQSSYDLYQ